MCSKLTLSLLKFVNNISYKLYLIPYELIRDGPVTGHLEYCGDHRARLCRVMICFHLLCQISTVFGVGSYYDLTHDLPMTERSQYYFLCSVECMALSFQVLILLFPRKVFALQSTYLHFMDKLSKSLAFITLANEIYRNARS